MFLFHSLEISYLLFQKSLSPNTKKGPEFKGSINPVPNILFYFKIEEIPNKRIVLPQNFAALTFLIDSHFLPSISQLVVEITHKVFQ